MHDELSGLARLLGSAGRGFLSLGDGPAACNARLSSFGLAPTPEQRRAYRELILSAPGLERFVNGAILDDETLHQRTRAGTRFADALRERGIVPGVRADAGSVALALAPRETVAEGLDGLRGRLVECAALGAGFAAWRASFRIDEEGRPTDRAVAANAHALARFAAAAQDCGLVPVLDVEMLSDGTHDVARSADATSRVLRRTFGELTDAGVALDAVILQTSMVAPGLDARERLETAEVVAETLRVLGATVPLAVAAIAFVSDADAGDAALERLCAMNTTMPRRRPWPLTFVFGRSVQHAALAAWRGMPERAREAQRVVVERAERSSLAACGAFGGKRAGVPSLPAMMRVA